MSTGYSGKTLREKLGIRENDLIVTIHRPGEYVKLLGPDAYFLKVFEWPLFLWFREDYGPQRPDIVHLFTNERDELHSRLSELRHLIKSNGAIWVSWYKKAAKLPTELTIGRYTRSSSSAWARRCKGLCGQRSVVGT